MAELLEELVPLLVPHEAMLVLRFQQICGIEKRNLMRLTDLQCRTARPGPKVRKLSDGGA